jgi:ABC-type Fe3+ transport system permease subunit
LTAFLESVAFFLFFFLPASRHQWLQLSIYSLFTTLSAALAAGLLVLPTSALRRQRSEVNNVLKESTELPRTTHNIPDLNLDGFDRIAGKLGTPQD